MHYWLKSVHFGQIQGLPSAWKKIGFSHTFSAEPAFLATLQTVNNGESQPWFTAPREDKNAIYRHRNVSVYMVYMQYMQ